MTDQSNVYCISAPARARPRSLLRPHLDGGLGGDLEPFLVERLIAPRGPQVLQHGIDEVTHVGVAAAHPDAEGLDAELGADDLEALGRLHEAAQDVVAAGERVGAAL